MFRLVSISCACFFLCSLLACHSSIDPHPKPILMGWVKLADYSNADLKQLTVTSDSIDYKPADYRLAVYRLTYMTTLEDGSTVEASGVVYLPSQPTPPVKPYPLLSYQHPTAFSNTETPSGGNYSKLSFSYELWFATRGYIVVAPDYVGYGSTSTTPHRYEHRQTLAQTTVDMLLAARQFLQHQQITHGTQTFMFGYSEGGYATLSAQKLIEEKYSQDIQLAGTSCGAGPYDMSAFFNYITTNRTVGGVANYIYTWQTTTYDRIYKLNKPVSYYFRSPYAEQISQSMDNAWTVTASFSDLCTDQFKADIKNAASPFSQALTDDDLTNWTARTPTRLIHSQQDEIIPYLTSQRTYAALKRNGSGNVSLITLPQGGHVFAEVGAVRQSLAWIEQLREH